MDGGTQPRAALDYDAIEDYAEAMAAGVKFPPVTVFYDGESYWLADGFHRLKAAWQNSATKIRADVRQGTLQDAQWFSFAANRSNGLRRTNEDKQRAVKAALAHPNGARLSNSKIASHVGVDESTVRVWREKVTSGFPKSPLRTGRDGRTINVTNIGKRAAFIRPPSQAAPPPPPPPPASASRPPSANSPALEPEPETFRAVKLLASSDPTHLIKWLRRSGAPSQISTMEKAREFLNKAINAAAEGSAGRPARERAAV